MLDRKSSGSAAPEVLQVFLHSPREADNPNLAAKGVIRMTGNESAPSPFVVPSLRLNSCKLLEST